MYFRERTPNGCRRVGAVPGFVKRGLVFVISSRHEGQKWVDNLNDNCVNGMEERVMYVSGCER